MKNFDQTASSLDREPTEGPDIPAPPIIRPHTLDAPVLDAFSEEADNNIDVQTLHDPRGGQPRHFTTVAGALVSMILRGFGLTREAAVRFAVSCYPHEVPWRGQDKEDPPTWDSAVFEGDRLVAVLLGRPEGGPPEVRWVRRDGE